MKQDTEQWNGKERRGLSPTQERLYRLLVIFNILAWLLFVVAMLVFHYARPELETGFMQVLGVESREQWAMPLTGYLLILLLFCFCLSLAALFLRQKRARRIQDGPWLNLMILTCLSAGSLFWLLGVVS
ncbi:hypothetical protein [Bowmanella dokdonensis]|uniref:Uncharacterized protein n=1 Tax=Bowmanella dokdonensis TaxID=751969 RepID=A0A939IT90_9ALTE|nr:hypothetical protein [Bowmanella dokdonensis]MBN7827221.1 hypothetical protein [Bowmanella dokdonensis]